MTIKKHIPNAITCLNCFSGILGTIAAYNHEYSQVLLFVLLAAFFDFCDGFMARLLKAYSPMGKELDSLADMVSFGFLPGMVAFSLLSETIAYPLLAYGGFIITVFSALRLAKFNIDTRQTTSFIGLATPANALLWVGLAYSYSEEITVYPYALLALALITSLLLVSEIPMFSLKIKDLSWSKNRMRYIFIFGVLLCIALLQLNALPIIMLWYVVLNLINLVFKW